MHEANIKNWTRADLRIWMDEQSKDHPRIRAFRADQVFAWLYHHKVESFDEMPNIGKNTINFLKDNFSFDSIQTAESKKSKDGSIKYRLTLEDGNSIETVLMPHSDHFTVCVSSQVGCGMGCDFCMTGTMGLTRNLKTSEIINQILHAWKDIPAGEKIRNIVFMGMGEPFHNYKNVMKALEILVDEHGFNFSQRRITVSTSGLLPKIQRFGKEKIKPNLAVSLNGVNDQVRSQLMPVNNAYNLEKLVEVCREFPLESRKRITFEYILMNGLTDSIEDAKGLIRLLHGIKFKVNLIPYNSSPESKYQTPEPEKVRTFQKYLLDHGVVATLRISKGQDIQGACGQLVVNSKKENIT